MEKNKENLRVRTLQHMHHRLPLGCFFMTCLLFSLLPTGETKSAVRVHKSIKSDLQLSWDEDSKAEVVNGLNGTAIEQGLVTNHTNQLYTGVKAYIEFLDEKSNRLSVGNVYVGDVPAKSKKAFSIPISFQGQPPIQQWLVVGAAGKRSDGHEFSAVHLVDKNGQIPLMLIDPDATISTDDKFNSTYYVSYNGPTFDSAFSTPGLVLNDVDLHLSDDKSMAVNATGTVTNRTDHALSYVEVSNRSEIC